MDDYSLSESDAFFVPFKAGLPVTTEIKGHKLLIVGTNEQIMLEDLDWLGGDSVQVIEVSSDDNQELSELAASIGSGVVMAPEGISIHTVLADLNKQLPWVN